MGCLYSWGQNRNGQCGRGFSEENNAIRDDKEFMKQYGAYDDFQLCAPVLGCLEKVIIKDICCGWEHTMVTTSSGLLFTWGLNYEG